jgi:hypothetical protein
MWQALSSLTSWQWLQGNVFCLFAQGSVEEVGVVVVTGPGIVVGAGVVVGGAVVVAAGVVVGVGVVVGAAVVVEGAVVVGVVVLSHPPHVLAHSTGNMWQPFPSLTSWQCLQENVFCLFAQSSMEEVAVVVVGAAVVVAAAVGPAVEV